MKKTDIKTLETKSAKELQKVIDEAVKSLKQLRLDHVQNKLKNTRSIFNTRKDIAIMQSSITSSEIKRKGGDKVVWLISFFVISNFL